MGNCLKNKMCPKKILWDISYYRRASWTSSLLIWLAYLMLIVGDHTSIFPFKVFCFMNIITCRSTANCSDKCTFIQNDDFFWNYYSLYGVKGCDSLKVCENSTLQTPRIYPDNSYFLNGLMRYTFTIIYYPKW